MKFLPLFAMLFFGCTSSLLELSSATHVPGPQWKDSLRHVDGNLHITLRRKCSGLYWVTVAPIYHGIVSGSGARYLTIGRGEHYTLRLRFGEYRIIVGQHDKPNMRWEGGRRFYIPDTPPVGDLELAIEIDCADLRNTEKNDIGW